MRQISRPLISLAALTLAAGLCAGAAGAQSSYQNLPKGFGQTPDTGAAAAASQPAIQPNEQAPQLPQLGEGILVSVNDDMITSYDLKQRMLLLIVTSGVQPTQENYAALQQQALSSLVDEHLQKQEMDHWKVTVSDDEINQELDRMASQSNMTRDQLLAELKKVGIEPQTLKDQVAAQTGWSELVGGRYHSSAAVGRAQVDATMDKIIESGQKPQYQVGEIYLDPATAGGLQNAQAGAKQLYDQIKANVAPFQAVARQFSNAPSAANGGDAGWLVSGEIDPAIETALKSIQPGQMTPPITTKDGVYIFLLRQETNGDSDMVMHLKQAAIPASGNTATAQAALESFRQKYATCDAVDSLGSKTPSGIQVTDLGDAQLSLLKPAYASALRPLKEGQATGAIAGDQEVNVLYVCDRHLAGDNAMTREDVENQLVNQRLSMLGKRYLRELRTGATIENH